MALRKIRIIDIASYLIFVGIALRALVEYFGNQWWWVLAGLLPVFLLLLISEPWLTRRFEWYPHLYLALQSVLVLILTSLPLYDYFAALYILLGMQSMQFFSQRIGFLWIGVLSLIMTGAFVYTYGWQYGLTESSIYVAANLFSCLYAIANRQAEEAREESQALLAKLQAAHRELQAYAAQVEELATAQERNRLARELHDSVTQTIFSMTLTAEAARILLERDPAQVVAQMDRLQELAKDALTEMRYLVSQLRPKTVAEEGLIPALRRHIAERQNQDGLTVALHVEGERRLPPETEEALFRIVQEALNNVAKHAQTDQAEVTLRLRDESASLLIEDRGMGFELASADSQTSHLGLTSMRERAKMLGATFAVESQPGAGTRIRVDNLQIQEDKSYG